MLNCVKNDSGLYTVGIKLAGTSSENLEFVTALVKSYHYMKKKSHLSISPGLQNFFAYLLFSPY
jgi:hypothetical protein